jgi:hypothetical protein
LDFLQVLLGVLRGQSLLVRLYLMEDEKELFWVKRKESLVVDSIALLWVRILVVSA